MQVLSAIFLPFTIVRAHQVEVRPKKEGEDFWQTKE
jgi:hypothetical protein